MSRHLSRRPSTRSATRADARASDAPAYRVDPAILALTLGGFVVVAAALTALTLLVSRRIRAAGALRTVEEG